MRPMPTWMKVASVVNTMVVSASKPDEYDENVVFAFASKHDETLRVVEAAVAFISNVRNSKDASNIALNCCTLYGAITGRSAIGSAIRMITALSDELASELPFWQTGNTWLDVCDNLYSNVHRVKNSTLGNKIVCVFNNVLAHAVYTKMGIEVDPKLFKRFEEKKMRPTVWEFATFADAVVGLLLFLAKAGRQAIVSGSIEAFFVDETVVTQWLDTAAVCRKEAEFISNPSAIGITLASYIGKLDTCIETGTELVKMFRSGTQHTIIHSVLLELKMVKNRYLVSMRAASFRRCPIGVFLYGKAGVAKSYIAAGLFNHYCSVRGIEGENAVCWVRDDNDPFYSGYKSHFAGVLYDDAAKFVPGKVQGVDPSIKDIISAVNNIPFITNQGELADKGKIPFLAEWVGVTSNSENLSADQYYNSSAAFLRRLPYRIEPVVKPQYDLGDGRVDTDKMPADVQYPDLWTFKVRTPQIDGLKATYANEVVYESYAELLRFMTTVYEKHIAAQDKLMSTVGKIGPEELCVCKLPKSICSCGGKQPLSVPIVFGDFDPVAQAGMTPNRDMQKWMTKFFAMKREVEAKYCLDHAARLYYTQMQGTPAVTDRFRPTYARSDKDIEELRGVFEAELTTYNALSPREKLDMITNDSFSKALEKDKDEFLDFEPRVGTPCFFLKEQLSSLREQIVKFIPLRMDDTQMSLLDDYLYHKAPTYVAAGWPVSDIIKGAQCYIEHYQKKVDDPKLFDAADYLLAAPEEPWWHFNPMWLVVTASGIYFDHPWVYASCNWIGSFRPVRWVVHKVAKAAVRTAARDRVRLVARKFDVSLGGAIPYVAVITAACATGLLVLALYKLFGNFAKRRSMRVVDSAPACNADINGPPLNPGDPMDLHNHEFVEAELQADLNLVGRKPTVRGDDKANVWTVTERNITKLDVDPRRPHTFDHAVNAVKNNLLYAETRVHVDGRWGTLSTQVLVVGNNSILMNNHFIAQLPAKIKLWLGPKTVDGIQPVVEIDVTDEMVTRMEERDAVILHTHALPALFRNISHVLPKPTFQSVGPTFYVKKLEDGTISVNNCSGLHRRNLTDVIGSPYVDMVAWCVKPSTPTQQGDCGSLLFAQTPLGCVLIGMHCAYAAEAGIAFAFPITSADVDSSARPVRGTLQPYGVLAQVKTTFVDLLPKDKLYSDYHEEGNLMVHGQLQGFRPRPKFTGRHTSVAHQVLSRAPSMGLDIEDRMAAPNGHPWKQAQMVLQNYLQPTHSIDEHLMSACAEAMEQHFAAGLTDDDWSDIHPVPVDVAVNGFPGVPNIDAQKFTTSGGHGFRGPKLQYLSEPEANEEWTHYRKYDDVVLAEVDRIVEDAMKGIRPHAIYTACMKDEMLSKAKVAAGKARIIYMCPVDFLTAMRMFTLGLSRVMVRRRALFGIAVGLNTHSEEWDDLMQQAKRIEGDNWVAGDFRAFESVLSLLIANLVNRIIVGLCERSGNYSDAELLALATLLADTVNPSVDYFGMLCTFLGGEVSGQQMTTFFNCLCNQLLHLYAYVVVRSDGERDYGKLVNIAQEWFEKVFRQTLGDDVFMKVCPTAPWYNHTSIQGVFASIGIEYTMADKLAASVPYIPLSEVSFLKRTFALHESFPGMFVAALDKNSIYKMLLYTIPSRATSEEEQLASAMASAQAEAFFHGREFFDRVRGLIDSLDLTEEQRYRMGEMGRPSWSQMIRRFVDASPQLQARMLVPGELAETTQTKGSYCQLNDVVLQTSWRMDPWGSTTMECSSEERIDVGVRLSPKRARKPKKREDALRADNTFLANTTKNTKSYGGYVEMTHPAVEKVINKLCIEKRSKAKKEAWKGRVTFQSSLVMDAINPAPTGAGSTDVVQETTVFKNEPEAMTVDIGAGPNSLAGAMDMRQDLATYLSRPKAILNYTWAENGANGLKNQYFPWQLFFNDANMAAKLRGFSLLRANLKLKFILNGSPFYYGCMLAAYTPLAGKRADTAGTTNTSNALVANSQKPHVWLENQNMSTAEMTLPFLYPYPYMDISTNNTLSDMGTLELWQYAPLLSANGTGSTNIDIRVYAWAEDVMLSGPTDQPILQSKFKPDGQISTVASAVGKASSALRATPGIGPYAMATEMAASALGGVASYFGFTNVPNVSDVQPYKPMPFQLATSQISEPVNKLSLQPKQETAIGSQQHGGLPEDELVIQRFCGRSSFVVGTSWDTTLTPGTVLFTTAVTPATFQKVGSEVAHTPVSYAANHFQYWRGSLRYTFKVIRSPYHRGRLQVSWDRATGDFAKGPTVGNPNTYTTVMDLDEESECSFVVPYMQPQQFLPMPNVSTTTPVVWTTDSVPIGSVVNGNGILSVRVVNRLTAPESSSSATILVFVNAEPDFQLAAPRPFPNVQSGGLDNFSILTTSNLQSKLVYDDASEAHSFAPEAPHEDLYKEVFGEHIASFRELLHRSSLSFMVRHANGFSTPCIGANRTPFKRIPPPPGVYNNGWNSATIGASTNQRVFYTMMHPILTIGNCFVGYKGSVNVTVNVDQPPGASAVDTLSIQRLANGSSLTSSQRQPSVQILVDSTATAGIIANNDLRAVQNGAAGMALTNTKTNAGMVAQLPYYSNSAFQLMNLYNEYSNADTFTNANNDWWLNEWRFPNTSTIKSHECEMTSVFYGTGPDFDLVFFVNVPIIRYTAITVT